MKTLAVLSMLVILSAGTALADSSGNFTATGTSAKCTATPAIFVPSTCTSNSQCPPSFTCSATTGVCTGGACTTDADCLTGTVCASGTCVAGGGFTGNTLSGGTALTTFTTSIQTPNGQGTALLIRPSLDTGLFTATKLSTTISNATADVGIEVCVYVDPTYVNGAPTGGLTVNPTNCVVYDQRIQQVSNTLFGQLTSCLSPSCTSDAQCAAIGAGTCGIPAGSTTGTCTGVNTATCNFETLLTTLAAHSFDFVVPMPGNGTHDVVLTWGMIGYTNNTLGGNTNACVGPVTLTVQQVKNFQNDQTIQFTSN